MDAKERRRMFLIRSRSHNNSVLSSGSDSLDSVSMVQGPRMRRRVREVGRLNPDLYRRMSHSSSSNTSGFGDIRLSYTWIGEKYDQLKIRILKIKNIPVEYYRAGLYIRYNQHWSKKNISQIWSILRLQCVSLKAESPPFQSSTQYGEEKRYYNDDIVFKVGTMNWIIKRII